MLRLKQFPDIQYLLHNIMDRLKIILSLFGIVQKIIVQHIDRLRAALFEYARLIYTYICYIYMYIIFVRI